MRWMLNVVAILSCAATPLAAQGPTGSVGGLVVNELGRPIEQAIVDVPNISGVGTLTGPNGEFLLRALPSGEHIVRARYIGYEVGIRFVRLVDGDSVHVEFRLPATAIYLAGVDLPIAPAEYHEDAVQLVRTLLADSAVQGSIRRKLASAPIDTIPVWIPWAAVLDTEAVSGRPPLQLVGRCEQCSAGMSRTLEGGLLYRSGIPHVRVGVTAVGVHTPVLTFCVAAAKRDDLLMPNCVGGRAIARVTYAQAPDRCWIRLPSH
jgi:hypothetical protein